MNPRSEIDAVGEALVALGAPFIDWAPVSHWSREEALVRAIEASHSEPSFLRVLPLVFLRQESGLDFEKLTSLAMRQSVLPELGMIFDLVAELADQPHWSARARRIAVPKTEQRYYFAPAGEYARRSAEAKTPPVALAWGFFLNMPLESFRSAIEKHGG